MGLGFPSIAAAHTLPVFDNMMKQNKLKRNIFSVYMTEKDKSDGFIQFGKIDKNMLASNLSFFPVTSDAYWEIGLGDISIGDQKLNVCD